MPPMREMAYEQEGEQDLKEGAAVYGQMTRQDAYQRMQASCNARLAWSSSNTHCSMVKKCAQMNHVLNAVSAMAATWDTVCHSSVPIASLSAFMIFALLLIGKKTYPNVP